MKREAESAAKVSKLREEMSLRGLDAVVIKKQSNFSWISSGGRGFIGLASENACASIVVAKDEVYLAANNIESGRLLSEELPPGFAKALTLAWPKDGGMDGLLRSMFPALSDDSQMDDWFKKNRMILNEDEIGRYRELGAYASGALEKVCLSIRPGMSEFEVAGAIAREMWNGGIEPITLLIAADDRSERVRHFVPTSALINTGVIASICVRSRGLIASATRVVAFRKGFAENYVRLLEVERTTFECSKEGAVLGEVMKAMIKAYEENGLAGEWENHHQGGLTGYMARELRVDPTCQASLRQNQALAWNPSAKGVKCEDTVLLSSSGLEILTPVSGSWPTVKVGKWIRPEVLRTYNF